jgi:hypothetical protein
MSDRASDLNRAADEQLAGLIGVFSSRDERVLRLPCRGREKLGDGSVAACAAHIARNYRRIAGFVAEQRDADPVCVGRPRGGRRITAPIGEASHVGGDRPRTHSHIPGAAEVDRDALLHDLERGRDDLSILAGLSDDQLDSVPDANEDMRFCDGSRSLEQILRGAFRHQQHQIEAIRSALS